MSWQQLLDITQEAIDRFREDLASKPLACPHDGTPLIENSRGEQRCSFCGWPDYF